jgi:microcystin degradation protein MlrC
LEEQMRIGIAAFSHETNTFALEQNQTMDTVQIRHGDALLHNAHPRSFIGGFVEGMEGSGAELIPTVGIGFSHGGIIGADVFERCRASIVDGLAAAMPLDGVYFALHGAAVAEPPYTDAEGELIASVRRKLGNLPMVGTYDFHAIMSDKEAQMLVAFPNNTNPHIDGYERGLEAGVFCPTPRKGIFQITRPWPVELSR